MDTTHIDILKACTNETLPDLDVVVLAGLELLATTNIPRISRPAGKLLVIGSVNAEVTGRVLFAHGDTQYANESTYHDVLKETNIDSAVIVSASGGKHAVGIAEHLKSLGIPTWLYTNNSSAPASVHIDPAHVVVFPKNREPYTYNTSTYLGMMLGVTGEDSGELYSYITNEVASRIPDTLGSFDAFCLIVPPWGNEIAPMFTTKFDELFGALVTGRTFTSEAIKHAKTVVPSETELFVSFGEENTTFGDSYARLHIPLPDGAGLGALMAVGYYVIGHIQKQHPPYFKEHIIEYTETASRIFQETITPIAE